MKHKVLRRVLTVLLTLVFVASAAMVLRQVRHHRQAVASQENALQIALPDEIPRQPAQSDVPESVPEAEEPREERPQQAMPDEKLPPVFKPENPNAPTVPREDQPPQTPDLETLRMLDLEALRQVNSDVFGWIHLPDTVISYPLVESHDNAEYLNLTWDKQKSRSGSIFLECRSSTDLTDFHTLIYGHNWQDGIMFSPLLQYGKQEFADAHPNLYLITDDAVLQYTVFSAYTADVVSNTYRLIFEDEERRQECIDFWKEKSVIDVDLTPETTDLVLTLSTCTGRGADGIRWVVHTVLTEVSPR